MSKIWNPLTEATNCHWKLLQIKPHAMFSFFAFGLTKLIKLSDLNDVGVYVTLSCVLGSLWPLCARWTSVVFLWTHRTALWSWRAVSINQKLRERLGRPILFTVKHNSTIISYFSDQNILQLLIKHLHSCALEDVDQRMRRYFSSCNSGMESESKLWLTFIFWRK